MEMDLLRLEGDGESGKDYKKRNTEIAEMEIGQKEKLRIFFTEMHACMKNNDSEKRADPYHVEGHDSFRGFE